MYLRTSRHYINTQSINQSINQSMNLYSAEAQCF